MVGGKTWGGFLVRASRYLVGKKSLIGVFDGIF